VGQLGGGYKRGQFTSNLRRRRAVPVTSGGSQSKWKGTQRGKERELTEGERGARGIAPCIYKHDVCAGVIE
jgi:hypothetical protein